MSAQFSRRKLLSALSAATFGPLVGCLNFTGSENIDITVSNASEMAIEYDVSIEEFAETGLIDIGGSDQYEDELSPPGSSSQFDVVASFAPPFGGTESEPGSGAESTDNQTADNESSNDGAQSDRFETTVDVNSDVTEVSVTYTGGRMVVNPVIANEN